MDDDHLPAENTNPLPRAIFPYQQFHAEVWCISDLLEHLKSKYQSSSEQKAKYLPRIFNYGDAPDLVIAVGTAEFPDAVTTNNGNVTIGTKVFMVNGHPNPWDNRPNPDSQWKDGPFEKLIDSTLDPELFKKMVKFDVSAACNRFLTVPLAQAQSTWVIADYINVALGAVNVTDYSEYGLIDPITAKTFWSKVNGAKAASVETTHGLIRVQSESPFLFVSGIVNRFGCFDQEVNPRSHSQNTAAAHNSGVIVSWLLGRLDSLPVSPWNVGSKEKATLIRKKNQSKKV